MNLGDSIKELCELNNITVKKLAAEIDMSEQNLYKCFKRNSMEIKYLDKIARVLKTPLSHFFQEDSVHLVNEASSDYGNETYKEKYYRTLEEKDRIRDKLELLQLRYDELTNKLIKIKEDNNQNP